MNEDKDCQDCRWFSDCGLRKQKEEAIGIGEEVEYICEDFEGD